MKMYRKLFPAVFLFTLITIFSCVESNVSEEYFEVRKDGKLWIGKPEASYSEYGEENQISILGVKKNSKGTGGETIGFLIIFSGTDTYKPISGGYTTFSEYDIMDKRYVLFDSISDQLTITEYDEESQIIAGTFSVIVRDEKDSTKTIAFSSGNFRSELMDYR